MTLPADYTEIPVHGKWELLDGSPAVGAVTFQPTQNKLVDGAFETVIMGSALVVPLDAGGEIALSLASTDDSSIDGVPFTYQVTVALDGVAPYSLSLSVPAATVGTLELAAATAAIL